MPKDKTKHHKKEHKKDKPKKDKPKKDKKQKGIKQKQSQKQKQTVNIKINNGGGGGDDDSNKKRKNDIFNMIPNIVFNPSLSMQPNTYPIVKPETNPPYFNIPDFTPQIPKPNSKTRNKPTIF